MYATLGNNLMYILSLWVVACLCLNPASISVHSRHLFKQPKDSHSDEFSFLVVGDWGREGTFNQSLVALQMGKIGKELDIDFVLNTGDNFYDDGLTGLNDSAFKESFTDIYTSKSLQVPWYGVLGNHDYRGDALSQFDPQLKKLDPRWHCKRSFILFTKMADFFFVDTTPFVNKYFDEPKNHTYDWRGVLPRDEYISNLLKGLDLALNKSEAQWKIVIGHHAIRSIGHHGDTQEIVQQILPILEAHKVDMYLNGHDHCLQHITSPTSNIQFLTSGGGSKAWKNDIHYDQHKENLKFYYDGQGFMSVKLKEDKVKMAFYDVYGNVLHDFKLYNKH